MSSTLPSVTGQSSRRINILLINPNSSSTMTDACLRSLGPRLSPQVTVHGFTCPKPGPSAIESNVDAALSAADCFRALAPFLRSGPGDHVQFDGLLVACFSAHPLIAMLREEYPQPTIGIMEAALYASRMCGDRLGILTTSERSSLRHAHATADMGLGEFFGGCETGHVAVLELESKPRHEVYEGLTRAARKLVDERGVDCICLGCAGMTEMLEVCREAVGMRDGKVMVVDGVAMGVQLLTSLVLEGLGTAKAGVYRPAATGREKRGQDWL